jgi:glycosyltransferase involved in cell wall biosynthesis
MLHLLGLMGRYAVVLHGVEAWRRLPWLSRLASRGATVLIATTRYTVREFCFHNGIESTPCIVIPLASSFQPRSINRSAPVSELRLLTTTRLSASDTYKGVDTILLALRRARDSGLNFRLELVGSGDDRIRLQRAATSLGVQDLIRFRGQVRDEELQKLLLESHVFVMPSKKEGFGIAFLEAMAAGLPAIGANHGGTPEVIEHGESGFLIEYGDADRLVFYLRALMESPVLYHAISEAARRRAAETLSFAAMSRSWRDLLETLKKSEHGERTAAFTPDRNGVADVVQ